MDVSEELKFLRKFKKKSGGGGGLSRVGGWSGVGLGGQVGCERRIEVIVKMQKKKIGGGGGSGPAGDGGGGGGSRGGGWSRGLVGSNVVGVWGM